MSYKIVRLFFNGRKYTVHRGLTLEEAKSHCSDPETSSSTCTKPVNRRRTKQCGPWFDSFSEE